MTPAGFPHSDIPGSTRICRFPRLIAAYHVLHRLLVPRHPPCALSNLTGHPSVLAFATYPFSPIRLSKTRPGREAGRSAFKPEGERGSKSGGVGSGILPAHCARGTTIDSLSSLSGGDSGDRTRNLRLAKPALSQLSYIPWDRGAASALSLEPLLRSRRWWA